MYDAIIDPYPINLFMQATSPHVDDPWLRAYAIHV